MSLLPAATVHKPRPPHLPPPFGLVSPRSPQWPPTHYSVFSLPGQKGPTGPFAWLIKGFDWLKGWAENLVTDPSAFANAVDDKLRKLALLAEADIHDAFTTNLDYAHAIVQHANDIGRAAERDILGLARDIHALTHKLEVETLERKKQDKLYHAAVEKDIRKARAEAITHAVADSRAFIAKYVFPKIHNLEVWVNHADTWWNKRITKWWTKTFIKQIRPIKTHVNNTSIQIGLVWATINGEIRPTIKLAAGAKDWLKWFAKWKRLAIEAFAALKAAEVLAWLGETYDHSSHQSGILGNLTSGQSPGTNSVG